MITLITGAPGSGKTIYTVSKMLSPYIGKTVKEVTDDGEEIEWPVVIITNIRGLLFDHQFVDYEYLQKWPEWCKPGMILVIDECQKLFVRRPAGSKVPEHVHELEEHRGKHSVDFVLITEHPMLIDTHVQNLVGRHLESSF